jgi:hypothetical protein
MAAPKRKAGRVTNVPQAGATINLHYPLQPATVETEVMIDFERQTLYFKPKGKKWQSVALWVVQEQCD